MKKKLNVILLIILLVVVSFILIYFFKQKSTTVSVPSTGEVCKMIDGIRLENYNECENISQERCELEHGTFNPCASACRHDAEAAMCTDQCVSVCKVTLDLTWE